MKVAVFGGSFDPIHTGHAMVASYIRQWGGFDEVWLMVSRRNPLKKDDTTADETQRLEMARLVADKIDGVVASDFELNGPYPSYTYDTLCALRERYPEHSFSLIIGSDNWEIFNKWRNADKIIREFCVTIYPRPGYTVAGDLPEGVRLLDEAPQILMSSTFVRDNIKTHDMTFFLPPEVLDYIKLNNLYEVK